MKLFGGLLLAKRKDILSCILNGFLGAGDVAQWLSTYLTYICETLDSTLHGKKKFSDFSFAFRYIYSLE